MGDFVNRIGKEALNAFVEKYEPGTAFKNVKVETLKNWVSEMIFDSAAQIAPLKASGKTHYMHAHILTENVFAAGVQPHGSLSGRCMNHCMHDLCIQN